MTERDNIIDWVTQVDMVFLKLTEPWNMFDKYEAFADLVRADEREALETKDWTAIMREGGLVTWGDAEELGERVRAAIKARGNT